MFIHEDNFLGEHACSESNYSDGRFVWFSSDSRHFYIFHGVTRFAGELTRSDWAWGHTDITTQPGPDHSFCGTNASITESYRNFHETWCKFHIALIYDSMRWTLKPWLFNPLPPPFPKEDMRTLLSALWHQVKVFLCKRNRPTSRKLRQFVEKLHSLSPALNDTVVSWRFG
jgi:hypothetical protein